MNGPENKGKVSLSFMGFLTGALLVGTGAAVIYFLNRARWNPNDFSYEELLKGILLIMLFAIAEECIFRGWMQRKLSKVINPWMALVICSVIFAGVHLMNVHITPVAIANIFLGGMIFGVSYMYTGSLLYVIFFHFSWNIMQGPVLGFPVSGLTFESLFTLHLQPGDLISGGAFGFEASIVCSMILLLGFLFFVWLIEK